MNDISVAEFVHICSTAGVSEFIYASENQEDFLDNDLQYNLVFDKVVVMPGSVSMLFQNSDKTSRMLISNVCKVRISNKKSMLGMIFIIACKNKSNENTYDYHTIIAR